MFPRVKKTNKNTETRIHTSKLSCNLISWSCPSLSVVDSFRVLYDYIYAIPSHYSDILLTDLLLSMILSGSYIYDYNHKIFPTDILTDLLLPMILSGYYLYHQIFSTDIPTDLLLLTPVKDCGQDSEF